MGAVCAAHGNAVWLNVLVMINQLGWSQPQRQRFAVETLAAWAMLAFLPPLLAVGIYFLSVHAWKHTLRLSREPQVTGRSLDEATWLRLMAVHRVSLPLLVLSLLIILPWAWWLDGLSAMTIAAASIGFYIISTLPHHLLGERWHRRTAANGCAG